MRNISDIAVTVCCLTYNHGLYIEDALDGILKQKTSFNYQIIIHDDASTDNTQDIIKQYVNKFPNIIVPILQVENQYSKGVKIGYQFVLPLVKGKYIAFCEGDDYWCDENKLQKQFEIMEANPQYSACVHNTLFKDYKTNREYVPYLESNDLIITTEMLISKSGSFFQTSSVFMRSQYFNRPPEFRIKYVGDYPRSVYLSLMGEIYYIKDVMSVYRKNLPGSWSSSSTKTQRLAALEGMNNMLRYVDGYCNYKLHGIISNTIRNNEFQMLTINGHRIKAIRQFGDIFNHKTFPEKIKYLCGIVLKK